MAEVKKVLYADLFEEKYERGWGYELWVENTELYCGKVLLLFKGKRSSLHYHLKKTETMFLMSGFVQLLMIDPDDGHEYIVSLNKGDKILITPGQVHQIIAVEDSQLIEFSTMHHESDSYRVRKGD